MHLYAIASAIIITFLLVIVIVNKITMSADSNESPTSFSALKAYDPDSSPALSRKPWVQHAYNQYMARTKPANAILNTFKEHFPTAKFIIMQNRFPYHVEPDINHLVAWINPKFPDVACADIEAYLHLRGVSDYAIFMNSPKNRSVKSILHYHLFVPDKYMSKIYLAG